MKYVLIALTHSYSPQAEVYPSFVAARKSFTHPDSFLTFDAGPGSLLTTDSLSSCPTNATHVDSLPHCTGSMRRAFLKDGIRIQVRRLVLVCRICADEEKHPPPSQITGLSNSDGIRLR